MNLSQTKKILAYLFLTLAALLFSNVSIFATEISTLEEVATEETPFTQITGNIIDPNASLDNLNGWIDSKGEDIFMLMQKVIQWICIICFIIFLAKGIFGLFGRGDMLPQALMGCAWTVVVYSLVTYTPQLLELGKQWFLAGL